MANVVFRVDSSSEIGMGHFIRCTALAAEFVDQGYDVFLITSKDSIIPEWSKKIYKDILFVENEWVIEYERIILEQFTKIRNIDVMIIDTYKANKTYYKFTLYYSKILGVFDDMGNFSIPADVVINGNIYATKLDYTSYPKSCLLLLGPKYLILRPQFKLVKPIQIKEKPKKILITFGGSDVQNATPVILNAVAGIPDFSDLEFEVLIGPGFKNINQIKQISRNLSNINLIYNSENIAEIMKNTDVAVTAAGSTVYELACLGIPSIVFITADNQRLLAQTMQEEEIYINAGDITLFNSGNFLNMFGNLIQDYSLRKKMHYKAVNTFDSLGSVRCVAEIKVWGQKFNKFID